jgi:hypothetical protein
MADVVRCDAANAPDAALNDLRSRFPGTTRGFLERMLPTGGDDRLIVDKKTGMTKYNIPMKPCPGGIKRGSCTCNVVSERAMQHGEEVLDALFESARGSETEPSELFVESFRDVMQRLQRVWKCGSDSAVCLFPSGTDAEFLPLLAALARCLEVKRRNEAPKGKGKGAPRQGSGILTVIAAAGEVGSGTVNAASGKNFSSLAPCDSNADSVTHSTTVGDHVFPVLEDVQAMQVFLRDTSTGEVKRPDQIDRKVEKIVTQAIESGEYRVVVLHCVAACKTGHSIPSVACVQKLAAKYGDRVMPVMDACQMRNLKEMSMLRFLDLGFTIVCTGSKFYGGPPFSAAVIFPKDIALEFEGRLRDSPELCDAIRNSSLHKYFDQSLVSDSLPTLKSLLPLRFNYGLLLRWTLALFEVERYHNVPEDVREMVIAHWAKGAKDLFQRLPAECITFYDGAVGGPSTLLRVADDQVKLVDHDPNENTVYGLGLPQSGQQGLGLALNELGLRGMTTCAVTNEETKYYPKSRSVTGLFHLDSGLHASYTDVVRTKPNAKFILTTRETEEWTVKLEYLRGQGHAIPDPAEYTQGLVEFFVHEEAAGRLLILDLEGESDEKLWRKLQDFVLPPTCRVDMSGVQFPRGGDGSPRPERPASGLTSPMDGELLLAKMKEVNSILSFQLSKAAPTQSAAEAYERLTMDELKKVHALMAKDLSEHSAALQEQGAYVRLGPGHTVESVLGRRCFIAQPVALNSAQWLRSAHKGCLRVAMSAPHVSDLYEEICKERKASVSQMSADDLEACVAEKVRALVEEDEQVFEKLLLILKHWGTFVK